jgi:regulator of sigma E protease
MDLLALLSNFQWIWKYAIPFLIVLTVLVFFHELGHYWVARRNGVRVEVFSVGFGRELFGWTDRAGTRWKFSLIPLGGYVRMFGDADAASTPGADVATMSEADKAVSFHHKTVGQRFAIVAAGPIANFLLAAVMFAGLFSIAGQPYTTPMISEVVPGSAAERAGIQVGDVVIRGNGQAIDRFETIQRIVQINLDRPIDFIVRRGEQEVTVSVTPTMEEEKDWFGSPVRVPRLGVKSSTSGYVRLPVHVAVWRAIEETYVRSVETLQAVGQMIAGRRSTQELGGPIRIAEMSGMAAQGGIEMTIVLMALLSINLGLINLFPIPMLDGGHLLFYLIEAVRGRPLDLRVQEYGFRIGLALILVLMVFTTWNDLVNRPWVAYLVNLIT